MTAEIAVMNPMAVALAADSAVSIGRDADKIFTSAEKLFQLSETCPIGIMVYGNANYCGMPWETIVKSFRHAISNEEFATVPECANRFFRFLDESSDIIPVDDRRHHVAQLVGTHFFRVRERCAYELDRKLGSENELDEGRIRDAILTVAEACLAEVLASEMLDDFLEVTVDSIRTEYDDVVLQCMHDVFQELPMSKPTATKLMQGAFEMLRRRYFRADWSGVVLAGFGKNDYVPSLVSYSVEESAVGRTRKARDKVVDMRRQVAAVLPFAQHEQVKQFIDGVHPDLLEFMFSTTSEVIEGAVRLLLEKVKEYSEDVNSRISSVVEPEIKSLLSRLQDQWKGLIKDYWSPLLDNVAVLPKDELGAVAEALVNLTKFRLRVTSERETVGGPIDVAVITKGDGFVWIKRKHYFDPTLNPRVLARLKGR